MEADLRYLSHWCILVKRRGNSGVDIITSFKVKILGRIVEKAFDGVSIKNGRMLNCLVGGNIHATYMK